MSMRMGMMSGPLYHPTQHLIERTEQNIAEQKEEAKQAAIEEGPTIKEVTGNMVEALSNSENPKHRNSKFLKFLNKLNYGAYKIENENVIKVPEKLKEFRAIETERRNKDILIEAQKQKIEETKEEEINTEKTNRFKNILEGNEELTMEKYNELMQEWM